jgi:hypothetical protein
MGCRFSMPLRLSPLFLLWVHGCQFSHTGHLRRATRSHTVLHASLLGRPFCAAYLHHRKPPPLHARQHALLGLPKIPYTKARTNAEHLLLRDIACQSFDGFVRRSVRGSSGSDARQFVPRLHGSGGGCVSTLPLAIRHLNIEFAGH